MKKINASEIKCPSCQGELEISRLHCLHCSVSIEGNFAPNEFSRLNNEDWHLLRIFLLHEGRIREMEGPLGLSYPTIRNRIHTLRTKLFAEHKTEIVPKSKATNPLDLLENGQISFSQTMEILRGANK